MEVTVELSKYVEKLRYEDLPQEVVEYVKRLFLDFIGVGVFGSHFEWSEIAVQYAKTQGGIPSSTIIGRAEKTSSNFAALINGSAAHGFELDDTHMPSLVHAGACVIPAALAAAEKEGVCGKELLTAITAGYEVTGRIGVAVAPQKDEQPGWHVTSTCGPFGAAAAVGKILGASALQHANALGIAGSYSGGTMEYLNDGAMSKRFHAGKSAEAGIASGYLAKMGFTGPKTIIEGSYGFCYLFYNRTQDVIDNICKNLGESFEAMNVELKPYSCCRHFHAPIEAGIMLKQKYKIDPKQVKSIIIQGHRKMLNPGRRIYHPKTELEAQMSFAYPLAVAFIEEKAGLEQFKMDHVNRADIIELCEKIDVILDKEMDDLFPKTCCGGVIVTLENGKTYTQYVKYPKGSVQNPMTDEEIFSKFMSMTKHDLETKDIETIIDMVLHLEDVKNVANLTQVLSNIKK